MAKRPNFLVIVADDLGYSDIGSFGGEIQTPNLDRLAKDGIRLTNFHTASACSPTRSMLMSGTDNHIAGLGQMAEAMQPREMYANKPGYEGYLNFRVAAMPEILQDAGYHTIMSGKWHLGMKKEVAPCSRGFSKSHAYLPGSGNHYNYEPQNANDFPLKMFVSSEGWWMKDDQFLDRRTDLPKDFYSTKVFTDNMLDLLEDRRQNESSKDKPFFAYLPYTAPHWPLQAPPEVIAKYKGMYDDGPEALRDRRLKKLKELGIVAKDVEPAQFVGLLEQEWDKLSPEKRQHSAKTMEVFAAMVDVMDQQIGRVIDYLEKTGELDNTFILFMSDNGAEGAVLEAIPVMGTDIGAIVKKYYNNSVENIGNADSFMWYGPRWACASMAPSRGFKTWITEGGIRCPCIVRYPPFSNSRETSAKTDSFATVMDILPTILDLASVEAPGAKFRGRDVVPMRGSSWKPHLSSKDLSSTSFHDKEETIMGWELFGNRAIRKGAWKAVWLPKPRGNETWELYNVEEDPAEGRDLAIEKPELLKMMVECWEKYYTETGLFLEQEHFYINDV